jgi:hypothetical protein
MKTRRAVLACVASVLAFAPRARADDSAAVTPPPIAAVTVPSPAPQSLDRRTRVRGPSLVMLGAGIVSFGDAYVIAGIVGATSSYQPDRRLFVPVLGPWLDLADRASCSPTGAGSCHTERVNRASLVIDGVFQGIGVLAIAGALAFPWPRTAMTADAPAGPQLTLAPVQYAHGGMGLAALGTF